MKKLVELDIPDGFEVLEDQGERGYAGQSTLIIKLKPISESALIEEEQNKIRINKMLDNDLHTKTKTISFVV